MQPIATYGSLAKLLRARYEDLKESGDAITLTEIATRVKFTQSYITALHQGGADRAVAKWPGERAYQLLLAHRFTTQEARDISEQFGLDNVLEYLRYARANTPAMRVKEGGRQVRFLGSVSAGRFGAPFVDDQGKYVDIPTHVLRHHDPADIFALDITGDSMVSDEARSSLPESSRVYFHRRLRPSPGQVVCARLEHEDMSVVKVYRPGTEFVTLESINRKHRPIVVDAGNPASIEGVLIGMSAAF